VRANVWKVAAKPPYPKNKNWLLKLLAQNRGLTTKKKLNQFLNPRLEDVLKINPSDTKRALERIIKAIKNKEKIGIEYYCFSISGKDTTKAMA